MADQAPVPIAEAAPEPAPAAAPHPMPCPRCGQEKGRETDLVCAACWQLVPLKLRRSWGRELGRFRQRNWAGQAIWKWALPDGPPGPPDPSGAAPAAVGPPQRKELRCARCGGPSPKPQRLILAKVLREVLPLGLPKEVRERAAAVAGRLEGLCVGCASGATPAPPTNGASAPEAA